MIETHNAKMEQNDISPLSLVQEWICVYYPYIINSSILLIIQEGKIFFWTVSNIDLIVFKDIDKMIFFGLGEFNWASNVFISHINSY